MKLPDILLEQQASVVLRRIAATINNDPRNSYTDRSCFGKVAHFLKNHRANDWYILLFGFTDNDEVTHCCLYSSDGKQVVDTFDGKPIVTQRGIVYVDKDGHEHELLASVSIPNFERYLTKS